MCVYNCPRRCRTQSGKPHHGHLRLSQSFPYYDPAKKTPNSASDYYWKLRLDYVYSMDCRPIQRTRRSVMEWSASTSATTAMKVFRHAK